MLVCFRCKGEFPSERLLSIHKVRCDGTQVKTTRPGAAAPVYPRRLQQRRPPAVAADPLRLMDWETSLNTSLYLGCAVTSLMGSIIWVCYAALTVYVGDMFWFLLPLAGACFATCLVSLKSGRSPNELADALLADRSRTWKGALFTSALSVALGIMLYFSTGMVLPAPVA